MLQRQYNLQNKKRGFAPNCTCYANEGSPLRWPGDSQNKGAEGMACQRAASNPSPSGSHSHPPRLECFTPEKNKRFLCYSNAQKAASLSIWKTHLRLETGDRLACIKFSRKRMPLSETVTLAPRGHRPQDIFHHQSARVWGVDMGL